MALPLRRFEPSKIELLRDRFIAAWARTDEIFALVPTTEILSKPIVWRHPVIFYVGHLPAFSWNQICGAILKCKSFNPYFDDLFCRGIDPDVDTGECHWHPEVPEQWPSLGDVVAYRDNVRGAILDSLEAIAHRGSTDVMAQRGRVFHMALEHEYMHQETLLYTMQQLPLDKKQRPEPLPRYSFQSRANQRQIAIPAGKTRLGAKFTDILFGWDNEFGERVIDVPSFNIDYLPVTSGEFFDFVDSGGYDDERYWRPEDWRWKMLEGKTHPTCWTRRDDDWLYRAMFDFLPLAGVSSWPVYVCLAEARAYACWRGKRLPTEAEFHRAAFYGPDGRESAYPWGDTTPEKYHGNFDFNRWFPMPVGAYPAGNSRWGVAELFGNGWELTDTEFAPLPGFSPYMKSYPDYSQDFFDGKHFVLKGGSWATSTDLLRSSFRNWYQAHYPYVFAKFRCVSV
ncbi:MAG: ergothioneine biosynthesis protein EgtB [Deltaproteobacteria bacterium]|nr:MAG: ergothioneine biosynthesis protein EgtB [Deltaproteobacteria bacterium]